VPLHLSTSPSDQAPLALCPGDPARAALAARELLEGARRVTEARGLAGFTGRWRGVPVTVQTTGMGGGSAAIVVTELIELGARALVRAGSCGGLAERLPLGALVVADAAHADDGAALALAGPVAPPPDPALTDALAVAARGRGRAVARGPVVSTDLFYDLGEPRAPGWAARGLLAVEMEAATLFAVAARAGARAGCVLGVSNRLVGEDEGWLGARALRELGLAVCAAGLDALVEAGAGLSRAGAPPRTP
jgi:DeoD family purine-nucleoside phosphorylase